ncbi:MAG: SAM-dependent methyltransferase [Iamia sp.]
MGTDWVEWHRRYDSSESSLSGRLAVVQHHIAQALDAVAPGPVRVVSGCAGQGRDLLDVLATHPRQGEVTARVVEVDDRLADDARVRAAAADLTAVEVVCGDASSTSAYEGAVPADLVLMCGIFGNVDDDDVRVTVGLLPSLCAPGATVIWTRYPRDPEVLPTISGWFAGSGFEEVALETGPCGRSFGVGVHRLAVPPPPYRPGVPMFTFHADPDPTARPA